MYPALYSAPHYSYDAAVAAIPLVSSVLAFVIVVVVVVVA
jgi:hypothetical protein